MATVIVIIVIFVEKWFELVMHHKASLKIKYDSDTFSDTPVSKTNGFDRLQLLEIKFLLLTVPFCS